MQLSGLRRVGCGSRVRAHFRSVAHAGLPAGFVFGIVIRPIVRVGFRVRTPAVPIGLALIPRLCLVVVLLLARLPAGVAAFDERSKNLITQADAYEVVPGVHLNGRLSSGENLADLGGVMLGYNALQTHLKANPQDDCKIDGFTPQQRCFLAWAQVWAGKVQPEPLRTHAAMDPHPPGAYRMVAPARNHPGFYEVFGVRSGDRMWIDPKDRVTMW